MTEAEWRGLVPADVKAGQLVPIPAAVAQRIFRFHLVDTLYMAMIVVGLGDLVVVRASLAVSGVVLVLAALLGLLRLSSSPQLAPEGGAGR